MALELLRLGKVMPMMMTIMMIVIMMMTIRGDGLELLRLCKVMAAL